MTASFFGEMSRACMEQYIPCESHFNMDSLLGFLCDSLNVEEENIRSTKDLKEGHIKYRTCIKVRST